MEDDVEDGKGSDEELGYGYYVEGGQGENDTEPIYKTTNIRGEEQY